MLQQTCMGLFGSEKVNSICGILETELLNRLCLPFLSGSQCRQQMTFWNILHMLSPNGNELRGQGEVSVISSHFPDFYGLQPEWL